MKWIGFYDYTVILTYIGLISGIMGMKCAFEGDLAAAIGCLVFSGICDMFDGAIARTKKNRTAEEKNFGIQIDSLCDVICFGVFPAVYLYFSGVDTLFGVAILAFYVLCAVIRLGFFNVLESNRQREEDGCAKSFRGLPVTSAAIAFPLLFIVGFLVSDRAMLAVHHIAAFLLGVLFIADFSIPKVDITKIFKK